jgi:hypothetical protein
LHRAHVGTRQRLAGALISDGICKSGLCSASGGLVSTWRGDGNANDSLGVYDGTLPGAATFAEGISAQAFSFPAVGSVNFGSNAGNFGTSKWTMELWGKTTATRLVSLLSKRGNCGGYELTPWWDMRIHSGMVQLEAYTSQYNEAGSPGTIMNDGVWHHIAFVRNGGALSLYQDGVLLAAKTGLGAALNDSTAKNLVLGSGPCIANDGNDFHGKIDEVSLYHRAMSAQEIAAQAKGQCIGVDNTLVQEPKGFLEIHPTTVAPLAGKITTIGLHLVAKNSSGKVITGSYPGEVSLAVPAPGSQVYTPTTLGTYLQNPSNPATMNNPYGVSYDATTGITYVLATNSNQVFIASTSVGWQWLGGTGNTGCVNFANPKTSSLYYPSAITADFAGGTTNLYIMDKNNGVIREMNSGGVSPFAGTPCVLCGQGSLDSIGTSASFNDSWGMGITPSHDLLVADTGNGRIRRVSTVDASVTTLTMSGTFIANPMPRQLLTSR